MSRNYRPVIGITMGDPAGIGPEIMLKALADDRVMAELVPLLIGDLSTLKRTAFELGVSFEPDVLYNPGDIQHADRYCLLDMKNVDADRLVSGRPDNGCGNALADYIKKAVELALKGYIDAITTCPINKAVMNMAGYHYPGHTEFLAYLTGTDKFAMMMVGGGLHITLLSIHSPLSRVPEMITRDALDNVISLTAQSMKQLWGIKDPRIAVAGLNPHAGEGGMFGHEEIETISPAIEDASNAGMNISGPFAADTLFYRSLKGEFDALIVMYHDQGLIPIKTLAFDTGVNVTLGLPVIRTSVDHGTAYDIAGRGEASEKSLVEALLLASKFAKNRIK